ncbi:DUF4282 domain-containing protein [Herminiimonas arsenitoxidans]|uniref:DUF4282 domain-containing protein n=1 Tax=Herminiimonas arsenitoxidans TaxID=1809410 RepID=UPI0012FF5DE9|nr:DUF4282 domain-containing protein [Herminiimonas arsenitoxidans]
MKNKTSLAKWFGYLGFDHLIAPFLIKVIYWGGVVLILSAGIGGFFATFEMPDKGISGVLLAIGATVLSLLIWRLLCEMLILAFNIYARLVEIRNLLSHRQARVDAYQKIPSVRVLKND